MCYLNSHKNHTLYKLHLRKSTELHITHIVSFEVFWCAKLYEHKEFDIKGWRHVITTTDKYDLVRDKYGDDYDDQVSSIEVRNGCNFTGYRDAGLNIPLFSATSDLPILKKNDDDKTTNDQITSFNCECNGKQYFPIRLRMHLIL